MSDNISRWKTKKLENLRIPMRSFYTHERTDWHPEFKYFQTNQIELENSESTLKGTIENEILTVSEIDIWGEGSGTFKEWILDNALLDSTGYLEAVLVWEDGDKITKLVVENGYISEEEIEL